MAKALGITDERTTCDCCGKSNLKCTVAMELDSGEIVYYGRVCASRNTGKTTKQINSEVRAEQARKEAAATAEYRASAEYIAERARFAERDEYARINGVRMVGNIACEFVHEACEAASRVRRQIAAHYGIHPYQIHA